MKRKNYKNTFEDRKKISNSNGNYDLRNNKGEIIYSNESLNLKLSIMNHYYKKVV